MVIFPTNQRQPVLSKVLLLQLFQSRAPVLVLLEWGFSHKLDVLPAI